MTGDFQRKEIPVDALRLPDRFKRGIKASLDVIASFQLEGVCSVILFGSCASENINTSSDIDLLIVTKELIKDRALRSLIRERIDQELAGLAISADIVFYAEHTLVNDDSVFTNNIRNYGKFLARGVN